MNTQQGSAAAAGAGSGSKPQQQKFLHALGLPPAATLSTDVLSTLPDGCGAFPYQPAGKKRGAPEQVSPRGQGL